MRTSFPLGSGETQKGSTWKCCLSTLLHVWTRCPEASRFSISIHERGRRVGGSLGCRKTDRPQAGGPLWFVVRCICHAPPARGVFQAAVGSGCHSSTAPLPRRHKLHIAHFRLAAKIRSFRCSGSSQRINDPLGTLLWLARTAGLPRKSVGGREQVSLSPALSSRPACQSRVKGSR